MKFLEKDLEQIVWETDSKILRERGLNICDLKLRQLRIGNYGIADIITFKRQRINDVFSENIITVYELKKDKIDINALLQATRYVRGIQSYLEKRSIDFEVKYKIVLVGDSVDQSSFCYIPNIFSEVELVTYELNINGLYFKYHENYLLRDEGF